VRTQTPAREAQVGGGVRVAVNNAEAALVEHYAKLVRIAYVTLPADMRRHRRVLRAHRVVQRALPRGRRSATRPPGSGASTAPGAGGGADRTTGRHTNGTMDGGSTGGGSGSWDPAYAVVRAAVLRGALAYGRRTRWWHGMGAARPPLVVGLRLFPRAGGAAQPALDRALAGLSAPARAAYALLGVERLPPDRAAELLARCGVAAPHRAVREAAEAIRKPEIALLSSPAFDPCVLHAGPPDLLRRRRYARAGAAVGAAALLAAGLSAASAGRGHDATPLWGPSAAQRAALDPASVVRGPAGGWLRADRLGFAAWPARGGRTRDSALLGRALAAWGRPGPALRISASTGTSRTPPATAPRLLFAGDVDGAGVVLFFDGSRLVRYAESLSSDGTAALDFARADDAEGASASAVVIDRPRGAARFLLAPWIGRVGLRDLLAPDAAAAPVDRTTDGVTQPLPMPSADPGCGAPGVRPGRSTWPALVLTPRSPVPDASPFLLTDLGDLTPAHLTYATGPGARQLEATGPTGRTLWAHTACRLAALRGRTVRAVGTWRFAEQTLPDGAGTGQWLCTRAAQWSGGDHVLVQFLPPGAAAAAPAAVSAAARATAACGPISPAVLSGVLWRSPAHRWYLLAAGSPEVTAITVSGDLTHTADSRVLALPASADTHIDLTGDLTDGGHVTALH
jgi:hypothetical protein